MPASSGGERACRVLWMVVRAFANVRGVLEIEAAEAAAAAFLDLEAERWLR